jgi:integrase
LAYEAADCGLLSPDLAAGIRRVKGVKKIGVRLGNWLTSEQSQRLWQVPGRERLKEKRDRALLAVLLACGLRRHEAVELNFGHIQRREEHWAIVDMKGKAGHTRTIPMPGWVKDVVDHWIQGANITSGKLFRRVHKMGKPWGERLTEKAVWHVVREYATKAGIDKLSPHDLRRTCARLCYAAGGELEQIQFLLGHVSIQTTIPRLQTADSRCRKRQNRNWATRLNERLSALPTNRELADSFAVCVRFDFKDHAERSDVWR